MKRQSIQKFALLEFVARSSATTGAITMRLSRVHRLGLALLGSVLFFAFQSDGFVFQRAASQLLRFPSFQSEMRGKQGAKLLQMQPSSPVYHSFNRFRVKHSVRQMAAEETFEFQADVGKVMDIIIHSLYSNKDVFLRESVSNAADACDKKRFMALNASLELSQPLRIRVSADKENRTLTVEDNGVGMTKDELKNNLGRIAQSGTKKFLEAAQSGSNEDLNLIGQFGVGFYSGYLVADKLTVITKSAQPGSKQLRWESKAQGTFTISEDESAPIADSGTRIVFHLKDDCEEYLDPNHLATLLKRYSEFVQTPIELKKYMPKLVEEPDPDAKPDANGTVALKPVTRLVPEWQTVNAQKPIWMREPANVTSEEYIDFYKAVFKQHEPPAAHKHFKVEGQVDFRSLIYIPKTVPYELSRDMFADQNKPIRLYVKRVFINDNFEQLVPRWLSFVRGVVDSEDIPLNVGREILQKSRMLTVIQRRVVRNVVDLLRDMESKNKTAYHDVWTNFGRYLKLGVVEDRDISKDLQPLLRFASTHNTSESATTSLLDYVGRMQPSQKYIYFASAETRAAAEMSPVLESMKKRNMEVLFATDPLDELALQSIATYQGRDIVNIGKERPDDMSDEEKQKKEDSGRELGELLSWLHQTLSERVSRVETSPLLVSAPAAIVQSQHGLSPTMQRFWEAQMADTAPNVMKSMINQPVLEINPNHPVITKLNATIHTSPDSSEALEMANLLWDVASLTGNYPLAKPAEFAQRVTSIMTKLATESP